jgi:hypothetical protein
MNRLLVVALFAACVVNIACLCGHLSVLAGPSVTLPEAPVTSARAVHYANGKPVTPAPARM